MRLTHCLLLTALTALSVQAGLEESFMAFLGELEGETNRPIKADAKQQWLQSLKKTVDPNDFIGDTRPGKLMEYIRRGGLAQHDYRQRATYEKTVLPFLQQAENGMQPAFVTVQGLEHMHKVVEVQKEPQAVAESASSSSSSKPKSRWRFR